MGIENGSTNRWKTARERDRLKARYLIQSRIFSHVNNAGGGGGPCHNHEDGDGDGDGQSSETSARHCHSTSSSDGHHYLLSSNNSHGDHPFTLAETNVILRHLQSVITNDISSFSITALARHGYLLNGPLPKPSPTVHVRESGFDLDLSKGILNDATSLEEASYLLSMMISTTFPWDNNNARNPQQFHGDGDVTDDATAQPTTKQSSIATVTQQLQIQPTTLATSKFGPEYVAKRFVPYMQHLLLIHKRQLTFMEYASLLGRHGIVQLLLLGGLDPTVTTPLRKNSTICNDKQRQAVVDGSANMHSELASQKVLSLIHSVGNRDETSSSAACCMIPMSIWSYMIRAIIEMRMNDVLNANINNCDKNKREEGIAQGLQTQHCNICKTAVDHLLQFGPPCCHTYCEPCMWNHLVDRVPLCTELKRNVVSCPVCSAEFQGFQYCQNDKGPRQTNDDAKMKQQKEMRSKSSVADLPEEKKDTEEDMTMSIKDLSLHNTQTKERRIPPLEVREQRRLQSMEKFMKLPANSMELKSGKKKNKKKKGRDAAHPTWEEALHPLLLNQSREVRSDRFFRAVTSSPHLIMAYLADGMDVNIQNSYGQTPLYLACWKGSEMVVRWLLDYGADWTLSANGGSTCYSVAQKYGRRDVLQLLERYSEGIVKNNGCNPLWATDGSLLPPSHVEKNISILIDPTADHPGAGACVVDNAISGDQLKQLETLWKTLPVADTCDDIDEKNSSNQNTKSAIEVSPLEGKRLDDRSVYTSEQPSYRPSRSYFCDAEENIQNMLKGCVQAAQKALASSANCKKLSSANLTNSRPPSSVFQHIRFLNYETPGGILPPHVDLCRVDDESGHRSTHTFILYMTDCERGGGTALLKHLKDPKVLAIAQPKRGRALLFPHSCPHSGLEVESAPKLLLRSEVILDLP